MDIQQIMQQAQKVQQQMQELQARVMEVESESGGGTVKVKMRCDGKITALKIDPRIIDPADPEMLEDLLMAGVNEAKKKADETIQSETQKMMGDMGLPPEMQGMM